jgi:hypothetical protein
VLNIGEKKRGASLEAKVYIRGFAFASQDIIECEVGFRINSHTINQGTLMLNSYLSATRCELTLHIIH